MVLSFAQKIHWQDWTKSRALKISSESHVGKTRGFSNRSFVVTKKNGIFLRGRREGIWKAPFGMDVESSINSGSEPFTMSMPPQSTLLVYDCETVCVSCSRSDGTLSHITRTICPWISELSNSMPEWWNSIININVTSIMNFKYVCSVWY